MNLEKKMKKEFGTWDKRLLVNVRKGTVKSQIKNIDSNQVDLDKFAKEVLNDDYYYEL